MLAERIELRSMGQARKAIEALGSSNSEIMAARAIHVNIVLRSVPGNDARVIKAYYNDVGAEAAISNPAYKGEEDVVTDMIVMGTVYQHREVRRVLGESQASIQRWIAAIEGIVNAAPETVSHGE